LADIFREEIDELNHRISERLSQLEHRPATTDDALGSVRQFYEDLANKSWTDADEESLRSLGSATEDEIKQMMREGFRRSPVHPVPSFGYLINITRRSEVEQLGASGAFNNPDAVSAPERERLASILESELGDAAAELAARLHLNETKTELLKERLQIAEGNIIGRFTPLV
jgi:hypothetical protein